MQRCKLNISLILLSTLGFAFACSDDGTVGAAGDETVGTGDETRGSDGADGADGAEGMENAMDEVGDGDDVDLNVPAERAGRRGGCGIHGHRCAWPSRTGLLPADGRGTESERQQKGDRATPHVRLPWEV